MWFSLSVLRGVNLKCSMQLCRKYHHYRRITVDHRVQTFVEPLSFQINVKNIFMLRILIVGITDPTFSLMSTRTRKSSDIRITISPNDFSPFQEQAFLLIKRLLNGRT